jgi:hypothetical protein
LVEAEEPELTALFSAVVVFPPAAKAPFTDVRMRENIKQNKIAKETTAITEFEYRVIVKRQYY